MTHPSPNADMIRLWNEVNGPRWVALQERLDAQLDPLGLAAMERLSLTGAARVLDVGCGCGSTSLELARRVAPGGRVTGVDISATLLARAAERARLADLDVVRFVEADAQTWDADAGAFDAAFSRFGVMFFNDPAAAFANVRRALAPRGSFVFVCWRSPMENTWVSVPMQAALPFFEAPAPPQPGAPGPFSLADRGRIEALLTRAGFTSVEIERLDHPLVLGGGGDLDATVDLVLQIGPTAALLREQGPARLDEVRAALRVALAPHQTERGVTLGAAMWVVRASR